jgi:hypothetical protein
LHADGTDAGDLAGLVALERAPHQGVQVGTVQLGDDLRQRLLLREPAGAARLNTVDTSPSPTTCDRNE